MVVYKICHARYSKSLAASGVANRWNKKDEFVIYCGSSISLATLELVAHRSGIIAANPYKLLYIEIDPISIIEEVNVKTLPKNWRTIDAYATLQQIGSDWYSKSSGLVLKVPSSIVPQEANYVINTKHPDFQTRVKLVKSVDFEWDRRLL